MGLAEKLEEIRKKPEHIRLRYVWFFVSISMAFVLAIWIFSMKAGIKQNAGNGNSLGDLSGVVNQIDQQKDSLQDSLDSMKDSFTQSAVDDSQNSAGSNEGVIQKDQSSDAFQNSQR